MKIFEFHGGLGNQIFEYIYLQYLKMKFPNDVFYSYFFDKQHWIHNGFELDKWFEVEIPPTSAKTDLLAYLCYQGSRILRHLPFNLPFHLSSDDYNINEKKLFHQGWYQDKKFFLEVGAPSFKSDNVIDINNGKILQAIMKQNSVAIHIRRGDYLLPKNSKALGGICTKKYYDNAISKIKEIIEDPHFFFFSDDIQFVEDNFNDLDKTVVNWNTGEKSFFDMYLMAHASNMILANSTFSCCAAYLNKNARYVLCPPLWNKIFNPDLNLSDWIVVDNKD